MIFQLIYSSFATQEFWPDDLFGLVQKARTNNAKRGITGMLLFRDGVFLQLLEGSHEAVEQTFKVVALDSRHTDVKILQTGEYPDRSFPEWTMGFENISDAWALPREWTTIFDRDIPEAEFARGPAARDLLLSLQHV